MVKEPIERLKEKVWKENLWIFIFKLLKEKDQYAYELRKGIKKENIFTDELNIALILTLNSMGIIGIIFICILYFLPDSYRHPGYS